VCDTDGRVVAKGLSRVDASTLRSIAGRRSSELSEGVGEVVHRDDLVVLPH
jgi:glutamate 5-kinase